ncbi:MAG: dihydroorotate dehydrogenase [Fidelibacterota bacterium]
MAVDTQIQIGETSFRNPVFVASGTFGYGGEVSDLMDVNALGAVITKSITLKPRQGNPPPRIVETPSGMLNSIGLANIGVDRCISELFPLYETLKTRVIVNIAGSSEDEYVTILEKMESVPNPVCGYEINISCPNVERGGMEFGVNRDMTLSLTRKLRERTDRLLIMKLSPNVTDIAEIARAAEAGGADALSAINTVVGMSVNTATRRPSISTTFGGLSGPAIRPVGIASVYRVSRAVSIPVMGIGGITSGNDAVEYFLAGAWAVQVGTASFRDPTIAVTVLEGIESYCEQHRVGAVRDLVGSLEENG